MKTYGYIRVSSIDQNEDRQLDAMSALGIPRANIFMDKLSGKDTARPGLQKLMVRRCSHCGISQPICPQYAGLIGTD
jgi:predicted site-specific integrase-resolvase